MPETHTVIFACEASAVVDVVTPEGATWEQITDLAWDKTPGSLCHQCARDYSLSDLEPTLVDDEPQPSTAPPAWSADSTPALVRALVRIKQADARGERLTAADLAELDATVRELRARGVLD